MKVKIGPYRNWIGPYQIGEFVVKFIPVSAERKEVIEQWIADCEWLSKICTWIDSYKHRKIKVRIDEYDTWNMDSTLSHIIAPMLIQLRDNKHGAPFTDDEDVPDHLKSTSAPPKENEWDTDALHFDRWDWILDEMIFAFETTRKSNTGEYDWEANTPTAEVKIVSERIANGYRLFGKYYQSLWD